MIKLSKLLFENETPFSVEEFLHQCEIVLSKVHDWIEQNSLGLNPIMELDGEHDDLLRKMEIESRHASHREFFFRFTEPSVWFKVVKLNDCIISAYFYPGENRLLELFFMANKADEHYESQYDPKILIHLERTVGTTDEEIIQQTSEVLQEFEQEIRAKLLQVLEGASAFE